MKTGDKNALKVGEKITINSGGKKKEYKVVYSKGNGDFTLKLVESVNEIQYKDAIQKFNDELIKHPMVKKVAQHYKKTPAEIVKVLQQRLSTKGNRGGDTKEVSVDFKDTDSGITIKHKKMFNESVNEGRMGKAVINQELKNMKSVKDFDALFTKMWNGDEDKLFMSLYHLVEEPKLQKAFFDAIKANLKKYPDGIV
jgi:hypothetical protein